MPLDQTAVAPQKTKPSDNVINELERLKARLGSTLASLTDLRDRVSGPTPQSAGDQAWETAFNVGGFVGGVGQALEQAHRVLTDINETVTAISDVI